jgi:hypothetical protein
VAQLLAAAAAAPTPEELAGQEAALAELRAVARARPAATMAPVPASPPRRRRRTGLAVVVVVGALVTSGAAGAATGHLPGPVRDAARAITGAETGTTASPTTGQPSTSATGTPNASGTGATASRPGGAPDSGPGSGLGSTGAGVAAGPAPDPALKGLCLAYAAGEGADRGGKLDATALADLAKAAGGEEQVAAFCEDLLPGDQQLKETKKTKDTKQSEQPNPSGTGPHSPPASTNGQGDPPASTESGQSQGTSPSEAGRP